MLVVVVLAWLVVDLREVDLLEDALEVGPLILVLKLDHCMSVDPSMSLTVLVVLVFLFRFANPAMVLLLFSHLDCSMMTSCPMMTCPMTLSMTVVSNLLLAGQVFGCLSLLVSTRTPCSCPLAGASS